MNGSLGSLGVDVFANTATFESDMGKAARIAEREMAQIERAAKRAGAMIGTALVAGAASFTYFAIESVKARAALDDLADATGDNVLTLDGIRRTAQIAGVELGRLEGVITKTAKGLDTKNGVSAIGAIGLDIEHLRAMKPADAMMEIARGLAAYEDGQGKINVATAIWGKEGAKNLALMKDLAEAGQQQGKITAEMAAQSDRAEKEWRKFTLALNDSKESMVTGVVPAVTRLIAEMNEGIRIAGGFGNALKLAWSQPISDAFRSPTENIKATNEEIERLAGSSARLRSGGFTASAEANEKDLAMARKRLEFYKFQQREEALLLGGAGSLDARDLKAAQRPGIDFSKIADPKGKDRSLKPDEILRMQLQSWEQFRREVEQGEAQISAMESEEGKKRLQNYELILKGKREADEAYVLAMVGANRFALGEEENLATRVQAIGEQVKVTNDFARDMGLTFSSAFEEAVLGGKKLSDVLKGVGRDLAAIVMRKTVTEPLGKAATGWLESIDWSKIFSPRAEGGPVMSGQPYLVGERGPELFVPGASGEIVPNGALGGGGGGLVVHINAPGADAAQLRRVEMAVQKLHGSLEARSIAAMRTARSRGMG